MGGTVLTVSSRAFLECCERLGIDTSAILAAVGVDRAVIDDPDGHLPTPVAREIWRRAYEASGDPDLALHAAEGLRFGSYRVIDYLAGSAPTIGAAITHVSDYFPVINSAVRLPIVDRGAEITLGVTSPGDPSHLSRPYVEYTYAAIFRHVRKASGVAFPLLGVEVAFPAPKSIAEHERIFECPVRFGAGENVMRFSRSTWDTASARADPDLFSVLADHARLLGQKVPSEPAAVREVRHAIVEQLKQGSASLEVVAKKLAMSPRTLQRRLGEHGFRYADLLDGTRESAAKAYLGDRELSVGEIAYLLGFAEQSSFNHAFKRWTGQAPSEYRKRS